MDIVLILVVIIVILFPYIWSSRDSGVFLAHGIDPLLIMISIVSTIIGGGMFLAVTELGYKLGVAGYFVGAATLAGLLLVGVQSRNIKRIAKLENGGYMLLPDVLGKIYGARYKMLFSILNYTVYIFLISGQLLAIYFMYKALPKLGYSEYTAISVLFVSFLSAFVYIVFGNIRKDIISDVIQFVIIIIVMGVVIYVFFEAWGKAELDSARLEKSVAILDSEKLIFSIGVFMLFPFIFLVRMDMWQRVISAKSGVCFWVRGRDCFWLYLLIAGVISLISYVVFTNIGILMYSSADREDSLFSFLKQYVQSKFLYDMVIVAFIAAVFSTWDTTLNSGAAYLESILRKKRKSCKISNSRISIIVTFVFSIFVALAFGNILDLLIAAFSIILVFYPSAYYAISKADMMQRIQKNRDRVYSKNKTVGGVSDLGFNIGFAAISSAIIGIIIYAIIVVYYIVFKASFLGIFSIKSAFLPSFIASYVSFVLVKYIKLKKYKKYAKFIQPRNKL